MCKYVYVLLFALIGVHVSAQEYVVIDTANIEVRKAENELFKTRAKLFRKELTSKYKGLLGVDIRNNFDEKAKELEKDILRLEKIADRFSKIGSIPTLVPENIIEIVNKSTDYLKSRVSNRIKFVKQYDERESIIAPVNPLYLNG